MLVVAAVTRDQLVSVLCMLALAVPVVAMLAGGRSLVSMLLVDGRWWLLVAAL